MIGKKVEKKLEVLLCIKHYFFFRRNFVKVASKLLIAEISFFLISNFEVLPKDLVDDVCAVFRMNYKFNGTDEGYSGTKIYH